MSTLNAPRWNLEKIYPSIGSPEYLQAFEALKHAPLEADQLFQALPANPTTEAFTQWLEKIVPWINNVTDLASTFGAYLYGIISTDSYDTAAMRAMSEYEQVDVELRMIQNRFKAVLGAHSAQASAAIAASLLLSEHAFPLTEAIEKSRYLMAESEEQLAAELNLSGGNAWNKLQGTVVSKLSVPFELDGKVEKLPMPALINLRSHPDESVRRRAYEAENEAWKTVEDVLAACLNGVKGATLTLNSHRGRPDVLNLPLEEARIDRATLDAMISAMKKSKPVFEKYFKAKAARLGKEQLAWWDLYAPAGELDRAFDYPEARGFILEHFAKFSPQLAAMAERAFDNGWIDAEQRDGKRGGAYCMEIPALRESRIMANFDGSLDQVSTIAHELGHAFHNECLFTHNKSALLRQLPMTLAETASIMCETIVMEAALKTVTSKEQELAILETQLTGDSQVIVDIYSRFLFEQALFEKRAEAELSPQEINDLMAQAQKEAFGEGLDERYLQPYMWTWKPHYYEVSLPFYNFPYSFGLLFGIGLYAIYQERGEAFLPDYIDLLANTAGGTAADLAARFGIDLRDERFWDNSLQVIARRVERYCAL